MPEEQNKLTVSVIIPAWNAGDDLDRCLAAVLKSDHPIVECMVVDDASTEPSTAEIARRHGVKLVTMEKQGGPGLARNRGASLAKGDVLMFTDADVLLHPDAIGKAVAALEADDSVAAVFGSYDDHPDHPSYLSRYRNLYHTWNHQLANEEASTFWTGCGAVRRDVFQQLGGFSAEFEKPSVEDIELGYRMRAAGHRIRLLKDMQGTHLKEWTFSGMVKTDIFQRGVPWFALIKRHPDVPADLNLNLGARVATLLAGLILLFVLLLVPGHPLSLPLWPWIMVPLVALAGIVWIQRGFFILLYRCYGAGAALKAVPLQFVFFVCCGVAVPLGYLRYWQDKKARA